MNLLREPPETLDRPAEQLQRWVDRAFDAMPNGERVHELLHGTSWLGHPLHPVLTDVPTGVWTFAFLLDTLDMFGLRRLRPGADAAVAVGLLSVPATALAGAVEWHRLEGNVRRVGLLHAIGNTLVSVAYVLSLTQRLRGHRGRARLSAALGFALLNLSAYLGGELVFQGGVGVTRALETGEELAPAEEQRRVS